MTSPALGNMVALHIQGNGRSDWLDVSPGTGNGLDGPTFNFGASEISWPDGDMIRRAASQQENISVSFSVNRNSRTEPHLWRSQAKSAKLRYGPPAANAGETGQPMYEIDVVINSANATHPPSDRARFEIEAGVDVFPTTPTTFP